MQEICIEKAPGEKLGISIRGGAKGHAGNPFDPTDEGIFISKVPEGSVAAAGLPGHRVVPPGSVRVLSPPFSGCIDPPGLWFYSPPSTEGGASISSCIFSSMTATDFFFISYVCFYFALCFFSSFFPTHLSFSPPLLLLPQSACDLPAHPKREPSFLLSSKALGIAHLSS